MSSDIDEEDYSSIDERDPKMGLKSIAETPNNTYDDSESSSIPAYANMNKETSEKRPDKSRYPQVRSSYHRKSRSRERPNKVTYDVPSNLTITQQSPTSPVNPASLNFADTERIKERERELEKIHRRSRELMLSPRIMDSPNGSSSRRDGSIDRLSVGSHHHHHHHNGSSRTEGWKPVSPPLANGPPPLPPRIHSPPSNGQSRCMSPNHMTNGYTSPPPPLPSRSCQMPPTSTNLNVLRRRVQSPNRRDFKDFSQNPARDFRSPMRFLRPGYLDDDDDDSGADSLVNELNHLNSYHNRRHHSHQQGNHFYPQSQTCPSSSSMALVPYEPCCSPVHHPQRARDCCCRMSSDFGMSTALQTIPGVEERLLQLEGDKDSLHLQVAMLSDQLESQTEKISDLEKVLNDKKDVLRKTEDLLQREMLTRSSLETNKLELLSEISSLKLRQASVEKENMTLRHKLSSRNEVDAATVMTLPPSGAKNYPFQPLDQHTATLQTFGTLPRRGRVGNNNNLTSRSNLEKPSTQVFLETHFNGQEQNLPKNAHSGSVPNLAVQPNTIPRSARHQSVERVLVSTNQYSLPVGNTKTSQQPIATKPKGLRKILGRMRRSNSGTIHEDKNGESQEREILASTKRSGGLRGSVGSKFASWMGPPSSGLTSNAMSDPNLPFRQWKVETICSWLDNLGLYMYSCEVRKHIKIGEHLLAMSSHDLETKLGMRSSLHRKKVLLALQVKQEPGSCPDQPGKLDHQWVVKWLDDVGLPQYKDAFLEARVDGRVLNLLTIEDLFQLKVTNLLHHLSIRRGIQVLRQNEFEPGCLKRRASPEERERNSLPIEVSLWTSHRVMEWLRHVDLSEYAPNLRGSGVHGGLIIYEPKFTADLLASLLSIPSNKTLLRRHLALHFKDLVGREVMKEKRLSEEGPNHQTLTPTAKVKASNKKSQFSLRRKKFRGDEMDFEDLVCPIEGDQDKSE